jgi:hypothetical protein
MQEPLFLHQPEIMAFRQHPEEVLAISSEKIKE